MDKEVIREQLIAAKKAHISWVQRAKSLLIGLPIEKEQIPVDCTACAFGTWFYSDAQKLNALPRMDLLKEVEENHTTLHDIYLKIFKIYFGESDRSFFSKLLGTKKKISADEQAKAEACFEELLAVSKVLLESIERLERRIMAIPQEVFAAS